MKNCRWKVLSAAAILAGAVGFTGPPAWAQVFVEDLFELDGNTIDETLITDPDDDTPPDDWGQNNFSMLGNCTTGNSCGYVAGPDVDPENPGGGAEISTFINDPNGSTGADNIFTGGGSKDDLPINGWKWTIGSPPDKDDLLEVGAAAYIFDDELLLYDFGHLFAANGDSSIGNWFFKKDIGPCSNGTFGVVDSSVPTRPCLDPQPAGPLHSIGDILIISENTNGGTVTNISLYAWVGGSLAECTALGGSLVPPKKNLCLIGEFAGATCDGADRTACGIMNQTNTESIDNYGFLSKFPPPLGGADPAGTDGINGGDIPAFSFLEVGINISEELGTAVCFSSFLKNTRTSASVRSQLKDFASGAFPLCGITVTKACPDERVAITSSPRGFCSLSDTTCNVDGDCPMDETCDITNPQLLFGDTVVTQFTVDIGKKGPADLEHVLLNEKTLASCDVIAVDGASISPIALTQDTFVEVLASLTETKTLTLECDTTVSAIMQSVEVQAQTAFGQTVGPESFTLIDEECRPTPEPGLNIDKVCNGDVKLFSDGGVLKFEVPVKITLTNTGEEDLTSIVVEDDKIGGGGVVGSFDLEKGALPLVVFDGTYVTTVPDNGSTSEWLGCDVSFSDLASVTGATGAFSGPLDSSALPSDPATCTFCPDSCPRGGGD